MQGEEELPNRDQHQARTADSRDKDFLEGSGEGVEQELVAIRESKAVSKGTWSLMKRRPRKEAKQRRG